MPSQPCTITVRSVRQQISVRPARHRSAAADYRARGAARGACSRTPAVEQTRDRPDDGRRAGADHHRRSLAPRNLAGRSGSRRYSGEAASARAVAFVGFVALISINLGFINLLPVPMLDGGHLLFYALEAVRRKPVAPEVQEWAFRSGLLLLLGLMLFVTFNDLVRLRSLARA